MSAAPAATIALESILRDQFASVPNRIVVSDAYAPAMLEPYILELERLLREFPAVPHLIINAGDSMSAVGSFTVPANHEMFIEFFVISSKSNKALEVQLVVELFGTNTEMVTNVWELAASGQVVISRSAAPGIPAKADVQFKAFTDTGTAAVAINGTVILVHNAELDRKV